MLQRYSHCQSRCPPPRTLAHNNGQRTKRSSPAISTTDIHNGVYSFIPIPAYMQSDVQARYSLDLGAVKKHHVLVEDDILSNLLLDDCTSMTTSSSCVSPPSESSSISSYFTCNMEDTNSTETSNNNGVLGNRHSQNDSRPRPAAIGILCARQPCRTDAKTKSCESHLQSVPAQAGPNDSSPATSPATVISLSPQAQVFTPPTKFDFHRSSSAAGSLSSTSISTQTTTASSWDASSICQPCDTFVSVSATQNDYSSLSIKEKRKQLKYKTELCREYSNTFTCAFGDACHYAHGASELRRNRLLDLRDAGLVDLATHRAKLCFDWCATGDCPFGNRCRDIHDTKFKGKCSSWLPLMDKAEFKSQVESRLYVDQLHHQRVDEVHNHTLFDKPNNALSIFAAVGNSAHHDHGADYEAQAVSAKHQVEIALRMRATGQRAFSYKTNKLLGNKSCMVLQKRNFRIFGNELLIDVTNIPHGRSSRYSSISDSDGDVQDVTVHEIVFDPSCCSTDHCDAAKRALWFNVPESALVTLNIPLMRRSRYNALPSSSVRNNKWEGRVKLDVYVPPQAPFELHTLINDDEYDIETEILKVYLQELKFRDCAASSPSNDQVLRRDIVLAKYKVLRSVDDRQRHIQRWSWPINADLGIVTCDTLEPNIDTPYKIDDAQKCFLKPIWESFLREMANEAAEIDTNDGVKLSRLIPLFQKSATGKESDQLPYHALSQGIANENDFAANLNSRSERCWKSLLVGGYVNNDWDLVKNEVGVVY